RSTHPCPTRRSSDLGRRAGNTPRRRAVPRTLWGRLYAGQRTAIHPHGIRPTPAGRDEPGPTKRPPPWHIERRADSAFLSAVGPAPAWRTKTTLSALRLEHQLAEVLPAEQLEQGIGKGVQPLDDVFAAFQLPAGQPATQFPERGGEV